MKGLAAAAAGVLLMVSCRRENRELRPHASDPTAQLPVAVSELSAGGVVNAPAPANPYEGNAWAIAEGQRLFGWFNCAGCHGNGGGGIGPALNDANWAYGGAPRQIFESIVQGRPNGMPTWRGKIPENQVWQLVTYVRSLSNQQPRAATPARSDHMEPNPAQPRQAWKEQQ
jgi:cytochrome c oxidase cbb3-type subunit III